MNKKLLILINVVSLSFLGYGVYGESQMQELGEKSCSEIYAAIGLFTHLAGEKWEEKNEEKAAFYASVASDYAVIYQTVCKNE